MEAIAAGGVNSGSESDDKLEEGESPIYGMSYEQFATLMGDDLHCYLADKKKSSGGLDTWMFFKMKRLTFNEGYDKECTICFEAFKDKEKVIQTPCKHIF